MTLHRNGYTCHRRSQSAGAVLESRAEFERSAFLETRRVAAPARPDAFDTALDRTELHNRACRIRVIEAARAHVRNDRGRGEFSPQILVLWLRAIT